MLFQKGETIICSITVKDGATLTDPATSMNISIYDPQGGINISSTAMTKDSTGTYHYDYATASLTLMGVYSVVYTATDGTRITIEKETFSLE